MTYMKNVTPMLLLRLLLVVMATSFTIILTSSGVGIYHLYNDYIVKRAEADAVSISQSFVAMNSDLLFPLGSKNSDQLDADFISSKELDEALRRFLPPFDVIKIKVFSTDRVIVYSTEASLIGETSHENIHLEKALSGYNSSKIQTKKEMMDLSFESRFNVDVVETYVPIYNLSGEIAGSFEIYQDMTSFRYEIAKGVSLAVSALLMILLIVFIIAIKILQFPIRQLSLVQNKLKFFASMDSLTSIYNRHEILKRLKAEAARVSRGEGTLSIILFDIDHFKAVNDTYGHPTGDDVLRKVAGSIQSNVREYNTVGRYGGEEFLVVLPNSDSDDAAKIAERIRQSIENAVFEYDKQMLSVTISAGLSTLGSAETNVEEMIKRADKALYIAKSNGRNQVMADLAVESTAG